MTEGKASDANAPETNAADAAEPVCASENYLDSARRITFHQAHDGDTSLEIIVLDGKTEGGASHTYLVRPSEQESEIGPVGCTLAFQHGPVSDKGVNGLTNEALLAIVIDRIMDFQSGPYHCLENQLALSDLRRALEHLKRRTRDRVERGVEGTNRP